MAVSVIKRPEGHILPTSGVSATILEDYSSSATINKTSHGLTDGDYIYIRSNVENYNGFWYVYVVDGHKFLIREYPTASAVPYIVDATITYYVASSQHNWNCVHLPIVYKLSNTLYPTNSADTVRTISSVSQSPVGYCGLSLSGDIKASGSAAKLEYVKISGASDSSLDGVYQIISYTNDTTFSIDLSYSSAVATALTGASIQYYYNDYCVKIRIYAGITSSHRWTAIKPYELITELKIIPDSNNQVIFSVNEYIKEHITVENNLLLATLPNNLDFWTQFYISVAESYADSDGTTLSTFTSSYTSDQGNFEGYAANAELAFKNVHSGSLSDYIGSSAQFLTLFDTPVLFSGEYFDLSFICNRSEVDIKVSTVTKLNGATVESSTATYTEPGAGILRIPIDVGGNIDQVCVRAYVESTGPVAISLPSLSGYTNVNEPSGGNSWTTGATPSILLNGAADETSRSIVGLYSFVAGYTYVISYTISSSATWGGSGITLRIFDASNTVLATQSYTESSGAGSVTKTHSFVAPSGAAKFGVSVNRPPAAGGTSTYTLLSVSATEDDGASTPEYLTEELCVDVNSECTSENIYLSWLNYLGGFDYWNFKAFKEHQVDIISNQTTKKNLFSSWPNSYGEFADTVEKEVSRDSKNTQVIRSQHLTVDQITAIKHIKTSTLVQIVNSRQDRRTVIPDTDSFKVYDEGDKLHTIEFKIKYTDDIPSQNT
jgi:hypothetical protein